MKQNWLSSLRRGYGGQAPSLNELFISKNNMHFVYLIRSMSSPARIYTGYTKNIELRLQEHNLGKSFHTAQHKPWELVVYMAFSSRDKAVAFEQYLKSGSGRMFVRRHLL